MKKPVYIILFLLPFLSFGQQPIINSISPAHAEVGSTITISGSNLGGRVFFGGVESLTVTGSGNTIQAEVPEGATQGVLSVLNNTLVAQSSQHFYISFSGSDITTFDAELSPAPSTGIDGAESICLCDLDGDNLNDVIINHTFPLGVSDDSKSEVSIFRNQSTPATENFSDLTTINTINLRGLQSSACGDLDNDGKPEMIFITDLSTSTRHILIYRNQSSAGSINLTPLNSLILKLPNLNNGDNREPQQVRIADMDNDGKNEIILGNSSDNVLHIFRNTSSGTGNFNFATAVEIGSGNDVSATLFVADLNNDGRQDILAAPFRDNSLQSTSSVTFLKNNSISGTFSFSEEGSFSNGTNRIANINVGDFDEDGLNDFAITSRDAGTITVARNVSSGGSISFTSDESITGLVSPFGLDFGDMNGDGKLDMISARPTGGVLVFENTSTSGNISFNSVLVLTTSAGAGNVCIGDLNGDAKPDIAYTLDVATGAIGKLGVQMNRNCMQPVLSPTSAETSFCDTPDTFTVTATQSPGATYNWTVPTSNNIGAGGNSFSTGTMNSATFQIGSGTSATIRVTITSQDGTCTTEFGEQTYSLIDNTQTATPTVQLNTPGPFCIGDNVILSTTTTHDSYLWTLPDGSTQTSATVNLASADISDVGTYTVRVQDTGECTSEIGSQSVVVTNPPSLAIFNNDDDVFCSDGTNNPTLEVSNVAGMSYQWNLDGSPISLETGTTYTATASGNYTVDVTDGNGCTNVTEAYPLTEVTAPVASLSGPTETCVNFETTFTSTSVTQNGFTAINDWTIVGPATSVNFTGDVFDVTLTANGTYQLTLTTSYDPNEVSSCSDVFMQTVTVSPEPVITFSQSDDVEKCELDALAIGINSPVSTSISSYDWTVKNAEDLTVISTGTNSTIDATTPTGVDSVFAIVTITTDIGCMVTDSVKVKNFSTTADISASLFDVANDTVTLEDDNFVELSAENLVSNIAWSPASIIRDTTLSTVTVFPANSPTIVTLSGTDQNGCGVTTSITVILNNIRPRRTFSPNGDGLGFDCWEILNTSTLQGCKIYVFDSRGKNILEKDSPFANNCVWDGNYNGTPVPEGLYYFVLKCDDSNLTKSGSILLAR